ncbi:hypothetical protein KFL_000680330 [Klebsormidium nitens]|uniref:Store-operated calcium entry-associated regulatory factor n=1 Tax=Klebsormidium nitens TaxID=105231 RepID=A0A0U9HJN3_KLENI|nr:hypothetical protein KFL_000680330 [Klebsormidium nitens]|eukprot:GAQ81016.1 hypothetical protein KFL_000680330 [Klebsormidium nitens]
MPPSCRGAWCYLLLSLSFLGLCIAIHSPYGKGVRLDDVQALTLQRGKTTTSRRAQSTPQLTCLGGPCEFEPETVHCENVGSDGMEVQWKCEADLPKDIKFAGTQVTCEGYAHPDDERVLEGSCALEYSLRRVGGGGWLSWDSFGGDYYGAGNSGSSEPRRTSAWAGVAQLITLVLVIYCGYHLGRACRQGRFRPRPHEA